MLRSINFYDSISCANATQVERARRHDALPSLLLRRRHRYRRRLPLANRRRHRTATIVLSLSMVRCDSIRAVGTIRRQPRRTTLSHRDGSVVRRRRSLALCRRRRRRRTTHRPVPLRCRQGFCFTFLCVLSANSITVNLFGLFELSVLLDRLRSMRTQNAANESINASSSNYNTNIAVVPLSSAPSSNLQRIASLSNASLFDNNVCTASTTASATSAAAMASLSDDPLASLGGAALAGDAVLAFLVSLPECRATTQQIVDHFKLQVLSSPERPSFDVCVLRRSMNYRSQVTSAAAPIFRSILKAVATFDKKTKVWRLNQQPN